MQVLAARLPDDLVEARLVDRQRVRAPGRDPRGVHVDHPHLDVGRLQRDHRHRGPADVAGANAADLHWVKDGHVGAAARQIQAVKGRTPRATRAGYAGFGAGAAPPAPGPRTAAGLSAAFFSSGLSAGLADERGRDRRADLAKLEDLQDVPALDRLVLEEGLGDLVQGGAALADDLLRPVVLLGDDPLDLDVDPAGGLLRDVLRAGDVAAKENGVVVAAVGDRPEGAHAPVAHHVPGDRGDLDDVAGRAARDVAQ